MVDEVKLLEDYIKTKYRSKASFAKSLGMTPQNLNHHINIAKNNGNIFRLDFKLKLQHFGILAVSTPNEETNSTKLDTEKLFDIIDAQHQIITLQKEQIKSLQEQLKPPLDVGKTGGRHA